MFAETAPSFKGGSRSLNAMFIMAAKPHDYRRAEDNPAALRQSINRDSLLMH